MIENLVLVLDAPVLLRELVTGRRGCNSGVITLYTTVKTQNNIIIF